MANVLRLDQFVAEQKSQLDSFYAYWLKQQDKLLFPDSLLGGDWDEQFAFFKEGNHV
jgi:hypothetical protein